LNQYGFELQCSKTNYFNFVSCIFWELLQVIHKADYILAFMIHELAI